MMTQIMTLMIPLMMSIIHHQARAEPHTARIIGGSLSLHFELPELGFTHERALDDAQELGLTHIALIAQATMEHVRSDEIRMDTSQSTSLDVIERVAQQAHTRGLKVIIFPIIWVMNRAPDDWRGTIEPADLTRWWRSYESYIGALADLAERSGATHLSIGSELSSMERHEGRWRALIRRMRARFRGELIYSANWDHYDQVGFWDALDLVGVTGYYPLATSEENPGVAYMTQRWRWVQLQLLEWLATLKQRRPLLITELGYPSQRGGALKPWHYYQSTEVDLLVQRDAFRAFTVAWSRDASQLAGLSIWNLWGGGGPHDGWYALRGKPAFQAVQELVRQLKYVQ